MSLFGSMMGDLVDDPIFGPHIRSMTQMNMMNSLFNDPFGMMGQNAITDGSHRTRSHQNDLQMMPFGFPPMPSFNMGRLFTDFDNMPQTGNCHSFTSRSVMTMASGPDGRPQVYQETMSTTTAPGGVKETKKTVCDSRTGVKKMAIGHHIGERAHILERGQNIHSGEREEHQELINLDEDEVVSFNNEWETRTRHPVGAIGNSHYGAHGHRNRPDHRQLALPEPTGSRYSNPSRWTPSSRRSLKLPPTSKTYNSPHALSSDSSGHVKSTNESTVAVAAAAAAATATATSTSTAAAAAAAAATSAAATSAAATATATAAATAIATATAAAAAAAAATASCTNPIGNRKREHTPDAKACKKRHAAPDSNI